MVLPQPLLQQRMPQLYPSSQEGTNPPPPKSKILCLQRTVCLLIQYKHTAAFSYHVDSMCRLQ